MATKIEMENPKTGEKTNGFYGYSWTTLLFGAFPALFRKDFITFFATLIFFLILASFTVGFGSWIAALIWSFMYNRYYTMNLLKKGFVFVGNRTENELAAGRLGIKLNTNNCLNFTD